MHRPPKDPARRAIAHAALAALGALAMPSLALAQGNAGSWPTRPVRVISPYGAGGSNDISARIVCEELGRRLGQQFIVENKPGAGTRLGNEMVARATPDGYTLLFAAAPFAIVESLYGKLSYDPRKDFKPISLAVVAPIFLVVNAASPFKTVADLVAHGKANPQGLTFASPGAGSGPHLAGELFFREAKVKGLTVHFRGDATAYTELLAGRVDATLTAITSALPHVQSGKLRVLAVASDARSPVYAEAPTMAEQGFPGVVGYGWFGMMAPAGTPDAVVGKVNAEMKAILEDAGVRQKMLAMGLQAQGSSPAEFAAFIGKETTKWAAVVKAADIKGE